MKKIMICASIQQGLGLWFIILFFVFGNMPVVKAEDISALNGATYTHHSDSAMLKSDEELVIQGDTLVCRNRITWASPDIADSIATGTNGFRRQIIGEWGEIARMPIVGSEARWHNSEGEYIFTISEDGSSITKKESGGSSVFERSGTTPSADKVQAHGGHAYPADCGPTEPNRTAPITTDLCPGNLVAMTYFCGGNTGCPYVCCPKGLPYLNHCDCKCYATTDFECGSHSVCQVQQRQQHSITSSLNW
ncbi:MAG: hypothetical protein HQL16_00150 [Candidatus Omnitrophica bacterium]|nr:hypothetical protein [Candidatus Omnitrophota bacterium]